MGKRSRSVRRNTKPVDTGAGRIRIFTGTPECRPTPEVSTGRWTVVSNRKVYLPHQELLLQQAQSITTSVLCGRTCQSCIVAKPLHFAPRLWRNWGAMSGETAFGSRRQPPHHGVRHGVTKFFDALAGGGETPRVADRAKQFERTLHQPDVGPRRVRQVAHVSAQTRSQIRLD